jgi:polar amino acid transport system permease protein
MTYTPSALQMQREAAKRRASRRSILLALLSTFVIAVVITAILLNAQGFDAVRESFFNAHYAREAFPRIFEGILLNLRVLFIAEIFVIIFGLAIAIARTTTSPVLFPLRLIATAYTDIFRGAPLLLVLLLVGLGIPGLNIPGVSKSAVFLGTIALVLTYSAYVAEVIRAGIEGVNPTQRQAARALGLSHAQTLRHVVLPQALRNVTPPLLNDLVSLQKDSGLISVLGAVDAIRAAGIETAKSFNFTPYVVAGGLFVLLTIPLTRYTDWLLRKQDRAQKAGGAY